ncbi:hypothetical protein ACFV6D_30720 [Kitasatospora sp. NPDC059812]|uniref:hypothetical protein n=1 Tax=Kitasatospora sp. NPDC059812 TaxID=3346958 RepID=UPI003669EA91
MAETRIRASGIVTPTRGAPRLTVSLDTLRLERDATGRVTGSRRVAGSADQDAGKETGLLLTEAAERTASAVAGLQSAVAQIHEWRDGDGLPVSRRAELLARVETPGGPVLLGTSGPGDPAGLVEALPWDELGALSTPFAPADPPGDWRERPLLLRPSAASVLVAGAAFSLTSRGGRATAARLAGRRILPQLTLTDLPSAPPGSGLNGSGLDASALDASALDGAALDGAALGASGLDDRGDPALPTVLVDGGRICPPPPLAEGIARGRAVWDHDTGGFGPPPLARLELGGPLAEVPPDAVELVWCVEGLQRYHGDGTVRLQCLARVADRPGGWFRLALRGKPVHLLRQARGLAGPPMAVHSDSDVTTRSLVLAGAAEMEGAGHAVVTVITP